MSIEPTSLPPPPPAFQRWAWHGIAVVLPDAWNLSHHAGTAARGSLIFSDLRGPIFEIRWRTPRRLGLRQNPPTALTNFIARLEKRQPVKQWGDHTFLTNRGPGTALLAADSQRIYELFWRHARDHLDTIAADFLNALKHLQNALDWPWLAYGAQGVAPARAKLGKARLLPGECSLELAASRQKSHFGSFSLADRILNGKSLREWAQRQPMVAKHPGGTWTGADHTPHYESRDGRTTSSFTCWHDSQANRLCWAATTRSAKA